MTLLSPARQLSLLGALALAACVTTPPAPTAPDAYRAATYTPPPKGTSLTLLPPQETQYDEMREGAELLHKQLKKQLEAAGYKVAVLKKDDYVAQWNRESAAVGGVLQTNGQFKEAEYRQALSNLISKSCEATHCALLIDARLVVRPAEVVDGRVEWDGRRMLPGNAGSTGTAAERTYGISVEVSGIQPDGSLAFKNYGGTVLPPQYSLADMQQFANKPMTWSDADLSAGLRLALQPLLNTTASQPASQTPVVK